MSGREHYFTEQPSSARERRGSTSGCAATVSTSWTERWCLQPRAGRPGHRVLLREAPEPPAAGTCSTSAAAGADRPRLALDSPGATVWAVDVNTRALALTAATPRRSGWPGCGPACPTTCRPTSVRRHLVQPADPDRQGGLHACWQWLPRLRRRRGLPRGPAEPRRRLPARLAAGVRLGLPCTPGRASRKGFRASCGSVAGEGDGAVGAPRTAGPASSTCTVRRSAPGARRPRRPPGTSTIHVGVVVGLAAPTQRVARATAAHTPVPQDRVSPTPRSCTRMAMERSPRRTTNSMFCPSGRPFSTSGGRDRSSAASSASVCSVTTTCGLPMETRRAGRRPPVRHPGTPARPCRYEPVPSASI